MKRILPEALSGAYRFVEADSVEFEELYGLYRSNISYFEYFALSPTRERLVRDMTMLPDGCTQEQKLFLACYDADRLTALIDLIAGYPDEKTCYIGLFMVDAALQGRGVGTRIITDLCAALGAAGYEALRLAYGKHYAHAAHFWTKNGFVPVREAALEEYGELIVAQRGIQREER